MNTPPKKIVIASRESALAMWQAKHIQSRLQGLYPETTVEILGMTTTGDQILDSPLARIGGKGLFVKELEQALADGHGLSVASHLLGRHAVEASVQRLDGLLALGDFVLVLAFSAPAKLAGSIAQTRVERQIHRRKHDGDDEQTHPPHGQGVVHFTQIFVPNVPRGVVGTRGYFFTRCSP